MSQSKEVIPPTFYHHKPIKKFYLDGIIHDESALGRLKEEYVRLLESQMRFSGYVPRLDINPDFTLDYNHRKKYFEFQLTVHGTYTGRKQSEWIAGIDGSTAIYTQKNKSKEFLREQV
jgi:hypothetical protein